MKYLYSILFVLLVFVVIYVLYDPSKINCQKAEEVANMIINGVVLDKYLDEDNHLNEKLVISPEPLNYEEYFLLRERNHVYEKIEIGDYIIKERGSLKLLLLRGNDTIYFELDYNCIEGKIEDL
ncbi:MAG: hypothetical protein WBG62_19295 [Cyclobacteriaceae bacterium]